MMIKTIRAIALAMAAMALNAQTSQSIEVIKLQNDQGSLLAYTPTSSIKILTVHGLKFKDLNRNGVLDIYEDWRKPVEKRAKDLASKLSIPQIAGLMLYSAHQAIPARPGGFMSGTYNGMPFPQSGANPEALTDQQRQFLENDNLRHVLITTVASPEVAAKWNNNVQAFCEGIGMGIPANNSSDPRHAPVASAEYDAASGGEISMWPGSLGMAATFDPEMVKRFGQVAAIEYRALGITTALSPQIDIATDPRWARVNGTFGENPFLSASMAQAYCDGFQTSGAEREIKNGWGYGSVNAMVKHWPGGGSGEGGRDAHYAIGKYAVYPSGNFKSHLIPFVKGAFKLQGKTRMASAVMPYYTISWNQDQQNKENIGNSYNKYLITELLRKKYKFDGVACTDWSVTHDHNVMDSFIDGKPWGMETLSEAQRHYKLLMAGVDQFGGNNQVQPILDAYEIGVKEVGETNMRARMEVSAVRLLKNIFRVGLFENPYLDFNDTKNTVGKSSFMKEGYNAQLKSIVMLKNKSNVLPFTPGKTVYVPKKFTPKSRNFLGMETPEKLDYPVNMNILKKYFKVTDQPQAADYAVVFIENPKTGIGYDKTDAEHGGNGYLPISLQYSPYTAATAREISIAGGDPLETFTNRSYKNKSVTSSNITDLAMVIDTYHKMNGKPVIVCVAMDNPMVFSEFEKQADAILVGFRVQDQALLDILIGKSQPSGLLPVQMPADMQVVESQSEDSPGDLKCHIDSEGHVYDFGFGLDWKGIINDARTIKYAKH
ncbi:MAG: glycoside hydrolase family 3 C-terminal domain-containing protein [Saprospiraceae bacterium]|nr:glycoside hydrolase family 3 C-terminal domain-containing protein [Saprospiraceae bacterium]MBK8777834.1 glycoside hydrolase family 3 C-terminal domain-containing protein [Saprospiraceae bacterium]MBP7921091.1 glycoside hydrolase family 3 C-terminal domain-containing protein [Saprospiraceae bacterium]MBP8940582.1 glycoside hydrolase family 3 C-terminal domain-containing protein [Saprospiraceae bacterium]